MKHITKEELNEILAKHRRWLNGENGGERADLSYCDLSGANLYAADLRHADLSRSDLREANFYNAKLSNTKLDNVKYNHTTFFFNLQCPEKGSFIGYKEVRYNNKNYIIKLFIPSKAKRSSATTRKCRCSCAKVLEIQNLEGNKLDIKEVVNNNYRYTIYRVGEYVYPDSFDEDRWNECSHGIHFFITRDEAVKY